MFRNIKWAMAHTAGFSAAVLLSFCLAACTLEPDIKTIHNEVINNSTKTWTVTFSAGTGNVYSAPEPQQVAKNGLAEEPAFPPVLQGCNFTGWFTTVNPPVEWDFYDNKVTKNMTLTAGWELVDSDVVSVIFNSNGGIPAFYQSNVELDSLSGDALIPEPADLPVYAGHTFLGWFTDDLLTTQWDFNTDTVVDQGTAPTLIAGWNELVEGDHSVIFDSKAKDADPRLRQINVTGSVAVTMPADPTRPGYTFDDWYTDPGCTIAWDDATVIDSNITLYAKWIPITYTVGYDANDAYVTGTVTGTMTPSDHTYNVYKTLSANKYACIGYLFDRWNTKDDGSGTSYTDA
ncbi:MAG: InlB B-repeat-containing protein, partial [Treponema sp.]|nr:InlB B-repeat-containing protein [Treponema sp.]